MVVFGMHLDAIVRAKSWIYSFLMVMKSVAHDLLNVHKGGGM